MNSLSMLQVSFFCIVLLCLASVLYTPFVLVFALLILAFQYLIARDRVKPDYPEDYLRYLLFFYAFEIIILLLLTMFVGFVRSIDLLRSPQQLYSIFIPIIVIIFIAALVTILLKRKHTYGTLLFVYKNWAGVSIKSDLFARINEGNYLVKTGKGKYKPKERVKIMVEKELFGKPKPGQIISSIYSK